MNDSSIAQKQLLALKKKLDTVVESRSSLEKDFSLQSNILIQFINKLSLISKGIDVELDNRLAQLRMLFNRSAPFSDIKSKITAISKLLQQLSVTNESNLTTLHQEFSVAAENLQKINGLPSKLRRELRALLLGADTSKDTLIQYVPLLNQLLSFYQQALLSKLEENDDKDKTLIGNSTTPKQQKSHENTATNGFDVSNIEKLSEAIGRLCLSKEHNHELLSIRKKLKSGESDDELINHIISIFDLVAAEFKAEQNNAKHFLSSLSATLSAMQNAVKETVINQKTSQQTHEELNLKLQSQLIDMTGTVEKAISLDQVKEDINTKLRCIASTLEKKSNFEIQSQYQFGKKLNEMSHKMQQLEQQSQLFEQKLAEQQRKSMQDALTHLANRAAFDEYFTKAMVKFHHKPFQLALVVIDIDNFKQINDNYGHTAGDKTLQVIANSIAKNVKKGVFVGRYGGEEFVLIYTKTGIQALEAELNTLNKYVAHLPFQFKQNKVSITLSMGATHIKPEDNIHIAFERADKAMYQAKEQGKNQVVYLP